MVSEGSSSTCAYITNVKSFYTNENPVIYYNNPVGNRASELAITFSFDGTNAATGWRAVPKSGGSYKVELSEAERDVMRNFLSTSEKSREVHFIIRTKEGNKTNYKRCPTTFYIEESEKTRPHIGDIEITPINADTSFNTIINKYSKIRFHSKSFGRYNSYIAENTITIDTLKVGQGLNSATYFGKSGSVNATVRVVDSRGFVSTKSIEVQIEPYEKPYFKSLDVNPITLKRCDQDGTLNEQGMYAISNFEIVKSNTTVFRNVANGTNVGRKNITKAYFRYKPDLGEWSGWTEFESGVLPVEFSPNFSYTVQFCIADTVFPEKNPMLEFSLNTRKCTMHIKEGGRSIRLGGRANNLPDELAASAWRFWPEKGIKEEKTVHLDEIGIFLQKAECGFHLVAREETDGCLLIYNDDCGWAYVLFLDNLGLKYGIYDRDLNEWSYGPRRIAYQ